MNESDMHARHAQTRPLCVALSTCNRGVSALGWIFTLFAIHGRLLTAGILGPVVVNYMQTLVSAAKLFS